MHRITRKLKPLSSPTKADLDFPCLFDTIRDGILILNGETGEIRYSNPTFARLLGYTPQELVGIKAWDLSPFRDVEEGKAAFLTPQKNGGGDPMLLVAKSGRPVELGYACKAYRAGSQRLIQFNFRETHESSTTERTLTKLRKEIDLLFESGQLLNRNLDIESLYDNFSQLIAEMMAFDMIFVSTYNRETQLIHCDYAIADGKRVDVEGFPPIPLEAEGRGTQSRVIRSGKPWLIRDYQHQVESAQHHQLVDLEDGTMLDPNAVPEDADVVRTAMIVPVMLLEQVVGVVQIFSYHRGAFSEEDLSIVSTFASQFAVASNNALLYRSAQVEIQERIRAEEALYRAYDATIEGWSRALDLRDKETEGHTLRVTEMTVKLARLFHFSENELDYVRWGSLLHDIGKVGVPDNILLKPGPLTPEEWVTMRKHATFAYELLQPIDYLRAALDIPYCHHEKWDGTGYPRGLKGEEIPLAARIFAVVDVWEALSSDRIYRAAWPEEKVLAYLRDQSGTHFDPQILKMCLDSGLLVRQALI